MFFSNSQETRRRRLVTTERKMPTRLRISLSGDEPSNRLRRRLLLRLLTNHLRLGLRRRLTVADACGTSYSPWHCHVEGAERSAFRAEFLLHTPLARLSGLRFGQRDLARQRGDQLHLRAQLEMQIEQHDQGDANPD